MGDRVRIEPLRSEGVLMKVEVPLGRVEVSTDKGIVKVPFSHIVKIREDEEGKEMSIRALRFLQKGFPGGPL